MNNLHRITSRRKYTGGSTTTCKKVKSLQELKDHGEPMVKIAKVKGKMKQKVTVTKTTTTPKLIPLQFLDETPESDRNQWYTSRLSDKHKTDICFARSRYT